MFPNVRLMIVAILASIFGISFGLGLFAVFRVNHEPFALLSAATVTPQLAFDSTAPRSAMATPFGVRFQLDAPQSRVAAPTADTAPSGRDDGAAPQPAPAAASEPDSPSAPSSAAPNPDAPLDATAAMASETPPEQPAPADQTLQQAVTGQASQQDVTGVAPQQAVPADQTPQPAPADEAQRPAPADQASQLPARADAPSQQAALGSEALPNAKATPDVAKAAPDEAKTTSKNTVTAAAKPAAKSASKAARPKHAAAKPRPVRKVRPRTVARSPEQSFIYAQTSFQPAPVAGHPQPAPRRRTAKNSAAAPTSQ